MALRTARDTTLDDADAPDPLDPDQHRAGELPPPEDNRHRYIKVPLNRL